MKFVDFAHALPSLSDPRFHFILQDDNDSLIEKSERAHDTTALGFAVQLEKSRLNKVDLEVILRMDLAKLATEDGDEGALAVALKLLLQNASNGAWRTTLDPRTGTVALLQNLLVQELPASAVRFDITQFMLTGCVRLTALLQIRAALARQQITIALIAPDHYRDPACEKDRHYAVGYLSSYTDSMSDLTSAPPMGRLALRDIASALIAKTPVVESMSADKPADAAVLSPLTQALAHYDYPDDFAFDAHTPF